jgi:hypothetical protein
MCCDSESCEEIWDGRAEGCRGGESRADEKNKHTPGILDGFVLTWWVWEDVQPSSMLLSWPVAIYGGPRCVGTNGVDKQNRRCDRETC